MAFCSEQHESPIMVSPIVHGTRWCLSYPGVGRLLWLGEAIAHHCTRHGHYGHFTIRFYMYPFGHCRCAINVIMAIVGDTQGLALDALYGFSGWRSTCCGVPWLVHRIEMSRPFLSGPSSGWRFQTWRQVTKNTVSTKARQESCFVSFPVTSAWSPPPSLVLSRSERSWLASKVSHWICPDRYRRRCGTLSL